MMRSTDYYHYLVIRVECDEQLAGDGFAAQEATTGFSIVTLPTNAKTANEIIISFCSSFHFNCESSQIEGDN